MKNGDKHVHPLGKNKQTNKPSNANKYKILRTLLFFKLCVTLALAPSNLVHPESWAGSESK